MPPSPLLSMTSNSESATDTRPLPPYLYVNKQMSTLDLSHAFWYGLLCYLLILIGCVLVCLFFAWWLFMHRSGPMYSIQWYSLRNFVLYDDIYNILPFGVVKKITRGVSE